MEIIVGRKKGRCAMNQHRRQLNRLAGLGLLLGGLLLGGGTASAGPPGADAYGPCRIEDAAFSKCVHYKLQEARRLGPNQEGDCDRFTAVISDATYLYWTCMS
jgi:hypothetical protein